VDVRASARRCEFLLDLGSALFQRHLPLVWEDPCFSPLSDLSTVMKGRPDLLVLSSLDGGIVESGQKTSINFGRCTSFEVIGGAVCQLDSMI